MDANDEWLTVREAAREAGVESDTIRRWTDRNLVRSTRTAGGHRRISKASLAEMMTNGNTRGTAAAAFASPLEAVATIIAASDTWHGWTPPRSMSDDELHESVVSIMGFGGTGGLIGALTDLADDLRAELRRRDDAAT